MSGITNEYLNNLGQKIIGESFLGSYPCDLHPKVNNKTIFCVIFNLSKHNEKGTHFVAIFADEKNMFYFDPLGDKCKNKNILKFIDKEKKKRTIVNQLPIIQSQDSIFCGFYCIGFLLAMTKNYVPNHFFAQFDFNNLIKNDKIIINFIQNNV